MMIKVAKLTYIVVLFITFSTYSVSAQGWFSSFWYKLDAHELGTWNYLERVEADSIKAMQMLITFNAVTANHRKYGANHDHYDQLAAMQCKMIQKINGFYRLFGTKNNKTLEVPISMDWRAQYIGELKAFSSKLQEYQFCTEVPQSTMNLMYDLVYRYHTKRGQFIREIESRQNNSNNGNWATTISAEVPGIPLRFEFINGEWRVLAGKNVFGIKIEGQFGPTSKRTGLRTVHVITKTKEIFYELGNKPVTFNLPSSSITYNGETAIIVLE